MICFRTALLLFAVLGIAALIALHGTPRSLALIIVGALAAKSALQEYKSRL